MPRLHNLLLRITMTLSLGSSMPACNAPHSEGSHGHGAHDASKHHRFDNAADWAKHFESAERDAWQKPAEVVAALALAPTARVADIGSATGYFPVRIAAAVPEGRVWGIDIEPSMVRYLNERAHEEKVGNLFSVLGTPTDPLLPEPVDLILMVDTYHHIDDRPAYFRNLRGYLRPGGRLAIIDFIEGDLPVGPPEAMKVSPQKVSDELGAAGFALVGHPEILPYQYILIYEAKGE